MNSPSSPSATQPCAFPDRICVALADPSIEALICNSAAQVSEFPFQELRLDYLPEPDRALAELRVFIATHPNATFVATCRRKDNGGCFGGTPEAELQILLGAARAGCAFVDLSLESAEALGPGAVRQLQRAARVILSWHDFSGTGDLAAVADRMRPFQPDVCKIVPTATSLQDNLAVFGVLERFRSVDGPPCVALAMGEKGLPSRVLGLRAGSAFTFAASDLGDATAPGQVSGRSLRTLYRVPQISAVTPVYAVAGDPIRSSLSPLMLNTAFAQQGRDAVYIPLLTNDPGELFTFARELPVQGLSVTMPLKQSILPCLDTIDSLAARIGAVNTVRRTRAGQFEGFNSDAAGIVVPLEERLPLQGARVLVLGAGGAARAAVFGCTDRGAEVSIMSRRPEASAHLAAEAGAQAIGRDQLARSPEFDVLINATPAGMSGNRTQLPLDPDELRARVVFDLVYNPLETPLLRAASERGIQTIPGVEMFIHQGARQFELWTGEPAPVDIMREAVLRALGAPQLTRIPG